MNNDIGELSTELAILCSIIEDNNSTTIDSSISIDDLHTFLLQANGDVPQALDLYYRQLALKIQNDESSRDTIDTIKDILNTRELETDQLAKLLKEARGDLGMVIDYVLTRDNEHPNKKEKQGKNTAPSNHLEFEVILTKSEMDSKNFELDIDNIFGRAVVQAVNISTGSIKNSDVLLCCSGQIVESNNCDAIIASIKKKELALPSVLKFRRGTNNATSSEISHDDDVSKTNEDQVLSPVEMVIVSPKQPEHIEVNVKKHQTLRDNLNTLKETIDDENISDELLFHVLMKNGGDVTKAVNYFFTGETGNLMPDFRNIIGCDFVVPECFSEKNIFGNKKDEEVNADGYSNWRVYEATLGAGPLGVTVENILERTIIINIKTGGQADAAGIEKCSWVLKVNDKNISQFTHKEALQVIEKASRPMHLLLCKFDEPSIDLLRYQLRVSVRHPDVEKALPEGHRMTFNIFQQRIIKSLYSFPNWMVEDIFNIVVCSNRFPIGCEVDCIFGRGIVKFWNEVNNIYEVFLPDTKIVGFFHASCLTKFSMSSDEVHHKVLQCFGSFQDKEDKGEILVLSLLTYWLKCFNNFFYRPCRTSNSPERVDSFLFSLIIYVLEGLAIVENHVTWDALVAVLDSAIRTNCEEIIGGCCVPLMARLSLSPSPTARILPISLFACLYRVQLQSNTSSKEVDVLVQLRGMYYRLCHDENPLVRRAAIATLPTAAFLNQFVWGFTLLEEAVEDHSQVVRSFAVKSLLKFTLEYKRISLVSKVSLEDSKENKEEDVLVFHSFMEYTLYNLFEYHLLRDVSKDIRREAIEILPDVVIAVLATNTAATTKFATLFTELLLNFVTDKSEEVRKATIISAVKLAVFYHENEMKDEADDTSTKKDLKIEYLRFFLGKIYPLVEDHSIAVRKALGKAIGDALPLVGADHMTELTPAIVQLFEDSVEVYVTLACSLSSHGDYLVPSVLDLLTNIIQSIAMESKWRLRVHAISCIYFLAESLSKGSSQSSECLFPVSLGHLLFRLMKDTVCEVRLAASHGVTKLFQYCEKSSVNDLFFDQYLALFQTEYQILINALSATLLILSNDEVVVKLSAGNISKLCNAVLDCCSRSKTENVKSRSRQILDSPVLLLGSVKCKDVE